jgi:hypothetical protein
VATHAWVRAGILRSIAVILVDFMLVCYIS